MSIPSITCKVIDRRTARAAVGMEVVLRCLNPPLENNVFRGQTDSWGNVVQWAGYHRPEKSLFQFLDFHGGIQTIWQMCFLTLEYFNPAIPKFTVIDINFALSPGGINPHIILSLDIRGYCTWIQPLIEANLKAMPTQTHQYQHLSKAQNQALNKDHPSKGVRQEHILQEHLSFQPHAPLLVPPEQYQQIHSEVSQFRATLQVLNQKIQTRLYQENQLQPNNDLRERYQQEVNHCDDYFKTQVERLRVSESHALQQRPLNHQYHKEQTETQYNAQKYHIQDNATSQKRAAHIFTQNHFSQPISEKLTRDPEDHPRGQPEGPHAPEYNQMLQQHLKYMPVSQPFQTPSRTAAQPNFTNNIQLPPLRNFTMQTPINAQTTFIQNTHAPTVERTENDLSGELTDSRGDSHITLLAQEANRDYLEQTEMSLDDESMGSTASSRTGAVVLDKGVVDAAQKSLSEIYLAPQGVRRTSKEDVITEEDSAMMNEVMKSETIDEVGEDSTTVVDVLRSMVHVDPFNEKRMAGYSKFNMRVSGGGLNDEFKVLRRSERNKK